ncbi:MAG: metal-dependent transcriptional regulator [bacterium]|nr:metal-dependent transcriptional regulator [bacterium]
MVTNADQDYVKAIYRLQGQNRSVSTSSLAATLGVTSASVSGMLRKLDQARMVNLRRYRGVRLTERGRRTALEVIRRHRLIELFLVEILRMPWENVHGEAERLEHAVSDEVLARIDKLLGSPQRDPHGSPIPSPSGEIALLDRVRLDQTAPGVRGTICEVSDDDPEMLRHLSKLGLIPGARIDVREIQQIDETRLIGCGKKRCTVSPKVAAAVWISKDQ